MKRDSTGKFVNNWDSERKHRFGISLTSPAWKSLDQQAKKRGISRSELIEHFARSLENEQYLSVDQMGVRSQTTFLQERIRQQEQQIVALERQNKQLEALVENAPDAIARFDRQIRYMYVNRVVEESLGLKRDVLLGKTISHVISEPIGLFWEEQIRRALVTAQPQEIEFELAIAEGEQYYQARLIPELDEQGKAISVVVISQDITDTKVVRQQTQLMATQETERQVSTILESITDAFVAFDHDWCYTYVNQAAARILQKTPQSLLGKHVWHEVFPELVDSIGYQLLHQAVAQQVSVSWEEYGESIDRWLEVNAYPSAQGVALYFRDITERKQAQAERERLLQELETEHTRFEAVLQQLPTGVLIADAAKGELVLANAQAKKIVGYDYEKLIRLEEYIPITPFVGLYPDGREYEGDEYPLARSLQKGEVVANEEIQLNFSDGRQVFINVNSAPIVNRQNQIVAAVAVFADVTERKQIETERKKQAQALENQHKWLKAVLDLMPTPMIFIEPGTAKVTFANRIANELAGGDLPKDKSLDEYADAYYCTDANGKRIPTERMPAVLIAQGERLQNYQMNWYTPGGIRSTLCWGEILPAMYGHEAIGIGMFQDVTHLKQIEEDLRQTEERLQLSLSSAQMVAWDMDLIKNYVVCSPNGLWLWGIQEGTAEEFFAMIHPEDQQRVRQAAQRATAGEIVYQQEYRVITPDTGVRWVNSQGRVCQDATGRSVRMVGVSVDMTERKQLLQQLQHKEKQQEFLIRLNDAIRAISDPKEIMWQVVCATGQHFHVTRCTYGEIDSTQEYVIVERDYCNGVISVVGSHHMNSFGPKIIAQLKQGQTIVVDDVDLDSRTQGAGAAAFDVIETKSLLCVPLVKQGKFVALFVLHHIAPRNWTGEEVALMERIAEKTWLAVEKARTEEALREREAHLQLALKVGRMGAWDWNIQTGTLHWSQGHYTVLGLQADEGQPSYELWANRVHPDDLAQTEAKLQQAMQDHQEYHHEYRLHWPDGSIHWVEARGQFTYDLKGNPKDSIGAVIDITQRKLSEVEREQLLERERLARTQVETAQRQLATIFETSPVGMGLLDATGRFIAINEALAEINGLTRKQHLGYSIIELFSQSDQRLVAVFDEIYNTGSRFISTNFAINVPGRSDRSPGYYNVYYLPTTNSKGQVEDVLLYVVDVTERVSLERNQRFLAESSKVLASSLDYQTTLEQVAQLAVPQLADWCTVHIVQEDGAIEQIAIAHISHRWQQ